LPVSKIFLRSIFKFNPKPVEVALPWRHHVAVEGEDERKNIFETGK
jgi:hypothetical protein